MANMSNVDSEQIMAAASQLDATVNSIANCVAKIKDAMQTLNNGWQSDVKEEFMSRYRTDEDAMSEMLEQYREVSEGLRNVAREFDKAEAEVKSNMSRLRR
jgi:WXG100 family type VII secretion target